MGPQSSGKSTIGKILCHCQWIEKRCYTNPIREITDKENTFISSLIEYHRLDGYITPQSYIKYDGSYVSILHHDGQTKITQSHEPEDYLYPKLTYIPAERNFAAVIPNVKKYNETNDLVLYFIYAFTTARDFIRQADLGDILQRKITYSYDKKAEKEYVRDGEATLKLQNASSGVQSLLPLYIVTSYVLDGVYKRIQPLSPEQKDQFAGLMQEFDRIKSFIRQIETPHDNLSPDDNQALRNLIQQLDHNPMSPLLGEDLEGLKDRLSRRFFYKCSNIYIEEPEQNLFPDAQEKLLYWLISHFNKNTRHSAYITTHSPYILFALNNCVMGGLAGENIPEDIKPRFLSYPAWISPQEVGIYEIHNGTLRTVQDTDGLLAKNYLNDAYSRNSSEYLAMLSYYDA